MKDIPPVNRHKSVSGQSPGEARLLAMVAALASELAVTRERLDTVERLAESAGLLSRREIEEFAPTAEQAKERDGLRRRLIDRIFRPLRDDARQKGE
jgi:hypothetical protein